MQFYLMRHADAVPASDSDYARVLSDKGRKQAEKMGAWLAKLASRPLEVATSPYPRAHETATLVAAALGGAVAVRPDERLAPGMTPDSAAELMLDYGRDGRAVMLVGHAPDLARVAAYLLGAKEGAVELRKGAVASFASARPGFGGSTLEWLINPKL